MQAFPPEGISEPFKPIEMQWSPRIPFGVGGLNKSVPPDTLRPDQAWRLENFRVNLGSIEPAWGTDEVGAAKASPQEILACGLYKEVTGESRLFRIDEDVLQVWNGSAWSTITGGGAAMTGDQDDHIRAAMVLDRLVWVNGVDDVKTWVVGEANYSNVSASVLKPLGARYLCGYADRLIVADVSTGGGRNTQRIEWSANADPTDFDGNSAGGVTLYDQQQDAPADDIMGLAAQGNYLIVLRSNSIWMGLRTGAATAPIEFNSVVQGYGVAAATSVADLGASGVAYLGKDNIYAFKPGLDAPLPIGMPVKDYLFSVLDRTKLDKVRAAYVPQTNEYWLAYPTTGDTWATEVLIFSLDQFNYGQTEDEQAKLVWTVRSFGDNLSALGSGPTSGLGSTFTEQKRNLLYGTELGELYEVDATYATTNSQTYDCVYESPLFTSNPKKTQLSAVLISYKSTYRVPISLQFTIDGGHTWTIASPDIVEPSNGVTTAYYRAPQGLISDAFQFRLTHSRPDKRRLELVGYHLGFVERGPILGR